MFQLRLLFLLAVLCLTARASDCPQGNAKLLSGQCAEVGYIQGCATYSSVSECATCEYNYDLDQINKICNYFPKNETHCCAAFGTDGECSQCKIGLYLVDGTCKQVTIPWCLQKDSSNCLNCEYGSYLKNGKCLKGDPQGIEFDSDGNVKACRSGYHVSNGTCTKAYPNGCKAGNSVGCTQCYPPFVLSNGVCGIDNCLKTYEYGCAICAKGFYTKDKVCKKRNITGCIMANSNGSCQFCETGFALNYGYCTPDGCTSFNRGCVSCMAPSVLINGRCEVPHCLQFTQFLCTACEPGYRFSKGGCDPVPIDIEVCRACAPSFFLEQATCKKNPVIENCQVYGTNNCTKCKDGYYLSAAGDTCKVAQPGCIYTNQVCTSCLEKFFLSQGICFPFPEGCIQVADKTCVSCDPGYDLTAGKCVKKPPVVAMASPDWSTLSTNSFQSAPSTSSVLANPTTKIVAETTVRSDILTEKDGRYYLAPSISDRCQQNKANCNGKVIFPTTKLVYGVTGTVTKGIVNGIMVEYSLDGRSFFCYNGCKPLPVTGLKVPFSPVLKAKQLRVTLAERQFSDDAQINFVFDAKDSV